MGAWAQPNSLTAAAAGGALGGVRAAERGEAIRHQSSQPLLSSLHRYKTLPHIRTCSCISDVDGDTAASAPRTAAAARRLGPARKLMHPQRARGLHQAV